MCDYCGDMDRKHGDKRPLSEGVVGARLIAWFKAQNHSIPVEAKVLESNWREDWTSYRITFEDETVSDHKVMFDGFTTNILDIEEYNQVI